MTVNTGDWLVDGGEVGRLIRKTEWRGSSLGPVTRWPSLLRTVCAVVLESRIPMAVAWGPDLVLLYNDAYSVVIGDRHPAALGRPRRDMWPEAWHLHEPIFTSVIERGERVYFEEAPFPVARDGRLEDTFFTISYSPIRDESRGVAGCLVTMLETTRCVRERQSLIDARDAAATAAQREHEILDQVLERIPALVTVFSPAIGSFHVNAAFRDTLGWTGEDARGGRLMELCYPDAAHRDEVRRFMEAQHGEWREFEVTAKDGSRVPSAWANVRLSDHTVVGIGIDLRERRQGEAALRDANERLADADRRKDEFIAVLSHELRNPLAPIRYALPLLKRGLAGPSALHSVAVIDRQLDQLTRLVDDLLDVSRITRGKFELHRETTTLQGVVRSACEAVAPAVSASRHVLRVEMPDAPIWLRADPARLGQVIGNLMNNSVKFTPRGGEVAVEASREDGTAIVRVSDTGVGIPPDALPTVFEMFHQVHHPGNSQGGLGIGLALVKQLVEMHGGTIVASSDGAGRGATFEVRLPVADPPELSSETVPAGPPAAAERRLKVLVVDDNADLVDMLTTLVSTLGHDVRKALDGRTAVGAARSYRPDVVLLDIGLPVMSGLEVARELRQRPETAAARLVALTGWGQAEDRRQTQEAGFDDHLTKPTDPATLERLLNDAARTKSA
jgi:PAS domain S-box-containing protein